MPLVPVVAIDKPDKDQAAVFPTHRECYVVGNNGVFKQMDNPLFSVRFPAKKVAGLAEIKDAVEIKVKKLPLPMFKQVESFFANINNRFKGEAVVVLAWSVARDKWAIKIPKQQPNGMNVRYDINAGDVLYVYQGDDGELKHVPAEANQPVPAEIVDFVDFGTIHSHCDANAFHSSTDDKDEFGFDGLHITIGHLNRAKRDYAQRWILGGMPFKIEAIDHVVDFPADAAVPEAWIGQVSERPKEMTLVQTGQSHLQGAPFGNSYQGIVNYDKRLMHERQELKEHLVYRDFQLLSPREQADIEELSEVHDVTPDELAEWVKLRRELSSGGELTPDQPGYALERLFRLPIHVMTSIEARIFDLLETDPWLEDELMNNDLCNLLLEDENSLDTILAACVDEKGNQIFDPAVAKANRDRVILEVMSDARLNA